MENIKKQKINMRRICIPITIVLFLVIAAVFFLLSCENPQRCLFGFRIHAVTDNDNTVIKNGSLVIIKTGAAYDDGSQVETLYKNRTYIGTSAYAKGEVRGKCVAAVPYLGAILSFLAFTPVISSMLLILFTILCILIALQVKARTRVYKYSRIRHSIQVLFTVTTNSYIAGFAKGTIYKGKLKAFCVPGLNCYSCPGAYGACPLGSLQAMFTKRTPDGAPFARFPFYVLGIIMLFGVLCGRLVCGFLCPFGLVQDILHKIPLPRKLKIRTFFLDRQLRYLKYAMLIGLVILLPIFAAEASPWFCKLVCPSGMLLGGIPLMTTNAGLQNAAGVFTVIKLAVLFFFICISLIIYRPFCKYICPLGAIYGLMNKVSLHGYNYDKAKCTDCKACVNICEMGVDITKTQTSAECIHCGKCVSTCYTGALTQRFLPAHKKGKDTTIAG